MKAQYKWALAAAAVLLVGFVSLQQTGALWRSDANNGAGGTITAGDGGVHLRRRIGRAHMTGGRGTHHDAADTTVFAGGPQHDGVHEATPVRTGFCRWR